MQKEQTRANTTLCLSPLNPAGVNRVNNTLANAVSNWHPLLLQTVHMQVCESNLHTTNAKRREKKEVISEALLFQFYIQPSKLKTRGEH